MNPGDDDRDSAFTVYGRPGCGYCHAAVSLLQAHGLEHSYVDMFASGMGRDQLEALTGRPVRTVPQILHGDRYVGGFTDLQSYLRELQSA